MAKAFVYMCIRLSTILIVLSQTVAGQEENKLQQYISLHAKEMNVGSGDFKGLGFLDTLLAKKRIVLLGESSHGTEEYSTTKLQLIEYLHEKLGFKVVLFESPMIACSYFNLGRDTASPVELIRNSIQTVWHTKTVLKLFEYMKEKKLSFGGFDPQFISSLYPPLVFSYAFNEYPAIKNELLALESRVSETFTGVKDYARLKDSFSMAYAALAGQVEKLSPSPLQEWMKQVIRINTSYYAHLQNGNERDSCMAKNLIWLAEHMYPNEKIIVWAHNSHIDKSSTSSSKFMGKVLADHFKEELFVVGFYMLNGQTALNNREIIVVKPPQKGSLEALLSAKGFKTTFIGTNDAALNRKMATWLWGKDKQSLNLYRSYDAVVLVNGVRPPEYLKK
jgi:erythromycin esterase